MSKSDKLIEYQYVDALPIATQIGQVIQAGLPLETGLHALAEQTGSRRTRTALLELSQRLERGEPLEGAVMNAKSGLTRQMRTLIVAGLECGRLDSVMQYCVDQAQRAASLRTQIWLALSYPLFLFWFSTLICGFILLIVLPPLGSIFDDFNVELPLATSGLLKLSLFLSSVPWLSWTVFTGIAITAILFVVLVVFFGWGQRWATSVPLLGRIFRFASLMDLCQILSVLMASGLSLPRALQFAGEASDDAWLSRRCRRMIQKMKEGYTADEAAIHVEFPNTLCQAFRGAGSTGAFVESLRGLADIFAAQCQVTMTVVNGMIAQLAVFIVIGFAGATGILLFVSLVSLLNGLA